MFYCTVNQVHDIAFTRAGGGRNLFASVGSDGSVRMFDLRQVTILVVVSWHMLYESSVFV